MDNISEEMIAAYIENRLTAHDRRRVQDCLDASPELYRMVREIIAETSAMQLTLPEA